MAAIRQQGFTMHKYKGIIALDLDGTLLNSDKQLTAGNRAALARAAEAGWAVVPTTGRFYEAVPQVIRELPFLSYAITINGAQVTDLRTAQVIYRAELPWKQAVEIMTYLDDLPVIYDCYQDNGAWMTEKLMAHIDSTVSDRHYRKMLRELRHPVPELKAFLTDRRMDVQKMQLFTADPALRLFLLEELPRRYEELCVSSSVSDNVEINQIHANKGEALMALADHFGLPRSATIAFGDGLNDLSMIRAAGLGVAMANACGEVKADADAETLSCDEDGVAYGIDRFCFIP